MASNSTPGPPPREFSVGRFLLIGGGSVMAAQVLGLLSGTAGQMLLARLLTPEVLGAYFLTVSVVETSGHLVQLGLPRPVTRLVAEASGTGRDAEARGVPLAALSVSASAGLVVAAFYFAWFGDWLATAAFGSAIMLAGTLPAALWIIGQGLSDLASGALRGFRRVGLAAFTASPLPRLFFAIGLAGVFFSGGSLGLFAALSLMAGTVWFGAALGWLGLSPNLRGPRKLPPVGVLLASSLPLMATGIAHNMYVRSDLWILGGLFGEEAVALYGAAKRLIILVSMPLLILNLAVPPIVAELHARRDAERLQRSLRGAATLAGLPAIGLLLLFVLAAEPVLGFAYGDYYRGGAVVLGLLSIERFVFLWVGPCGMVLAMTGNERTLMFITLTAGALTIAAVFAGAQLGGIAGAAIGFSLGSTVNHLASWMSVRRLTGIRTDIDPIHLGPMLDAVRRAFGR